MTSTKSKRSRTERLLFPFLGNMQLVPELELNILPDPAEHRDDIEHEPVTVIDVPTSKKAVKKHPIPAPMSQMSPMSHVARVLQTKPEAYEMWQSETEKLRHDMPIDAAQYQALRIVVAHYSQQ